jgi:hypothetical protein
MKANDKTVVMPATVMVLCLLTTGSAFANGGPFVLKYPGGDPAAKGVLARLDPNLKPGRENRLRVLKEDLKVTFGVGAAWRRTQGTAPVAHVVAEYTIQNPTDNDIEVDFGFPILRGVYINPWSMIPKPDVIVRIGPNEVKSTVISNSIIYGLIRRRARETIERALADDTTLRNLVMSVRDERGRVVAEARRALLAHLVDQKQWDHRVAALMVEYASLDFGNIRSFPPDRNGLGWLGMDRELQKLMNENLGALAAIGEQKATQFFAQLASAFEPGAGAEYEAVFAEWGGDVRERSVDLKTGKIRPREITVDEEVPAQPGTVAPGVVDPTVYARVDYLDPRAQLSESERQSCLAILKNLPVVFTFAPMNILHYRVSFAPKSTQKLTVAYRQYAYSDTRSPSSYQLAYVVHPASFWKEFGPINLEVAVPEGVDFQASVACANGAISQRALVLHNERKSKCNIYRAVVTDKEGELFFAVDADGFRDFEKALTAAILNTGVQQVARQQQEKASR